MPFAARKPAFRGQKNKDQNQPAERVPLPSVSFIRPKDDFLDNVQREPLPGHISLIRQLARPQMGGLIESYPE